MTELPAAGLDRTVARVLIALFWISVASPAGAQTYTFTTHAGSSPGSEDGPGGSARFNTPSGVAADAAGNILITDSTNSTIRRISSSGQVTTLAGYARPHAGVIVCSRANGVGARASFCLPGGLAFAADGSAIVADGTAVRKVSPGGFVTTLAGSLTQSGSLDGPALSARFMSAHGIATDAQGNVYVTDGNALRKIAPDGSVSTYAGSSVPGSADGQRTSASFNFPRGAAVDGLGNLYLADTFNHTIRKIAVDGTVTTLAGSAGLSGTADGSGSTARFSSPWAIAIAGNSDLYVAETGSHRIRRITASGDVTTVAGSFAGSADGPALTARFRSPTGIAIDSTGNLIVADNGNNTIRRIDASGIVTTLAGTESAFGQYIDGSRSIARFSTPSGLVADSAGNLFVLDYSYVRRVAPDGTASTLAGCQCNGSADGTGTAAGFDRPRGLTIDGSGNLYVADTSNHTIRKITPAAVVTTLAGLAGSSGGADGPGPDARFNAPEGIAVDASGNVFVADTRNHTIRRIGPDGVVTTLAGSPGLTGSTDGSGAAARFDQPIGIVADGSGNVFVADRFNGTIRRIVVATGEVSTFAGAAKQFDVVDGIGTAARFAFPAQMTMDGAGNLLVLETSNGFGRIRKVSPSAVVTTVARPVEGIGGHDGTNHFVSFSDPAGIAADLNGNIYVSDSGNHAIRIGTPGLDDAATIDAAVGEPGALRQLGSAGSSASSWSWRLLRQPAASTAQISSETVRNPQFTPDVSDVFVFELSATNGSQSSLTRVSLTATNTPSISPATVVPYRAGGPGSRRTIATVSDVEDSGAALVVTVSSAPTGVSVFNLVNSDGTISAFITVSCTATPGANAVTLQVRDTAGAIATATLTIDVLANASPTLGTYPDTIVQVSEPASVTPSSAPADDGPLSATVTATSGFTGSLQVNRFTGVVAIQNANEGTHVVTVTVSGECGATINSSFTLTVNAPLVLDRIQNGGFEANNGVDTSFFDDWTAITEGGGPGSWYVQSGTTPPADSFGLPVAAPFEGVYAAMSSPFGAHVLYQDIALPADKVATIAFRLYLANDHFAWLSPATLSGFGSTSPNQQFRVDLIDPAASVYAVDSAVLASLYATRPGDPLTTAGYIAVTAGVPAGLAGRTVRLRFASASNQDLLTVGVDDVQLSFDAAPAISAGAAIERTAGVADSNAVVVATVSDAEDGVGTLAVTATDVPAGISVAILGNADGTITAAVDAACGAAAGLNTVVLQVRDSAGGTATANFNVNVSANPDPSIGSYSDVTMETTETKTATPSTAPTDNGTASVSVASVPALAPANLTVNAAGVVSIINPGSANTYAVTVSVTDDCNATVTGQFTVTVTPPPVAGFGAPLNFAATARRSPEGQVDLSWMPPAGVAASAVKYQIQRRSDADPVWRDLVPGFVETTSFPDATVQPGRAYIYRVRGKSGSFDGVYVAEAASTNDLSDDPLPAANVIRAIHLVQLRAAVNAMRVAAGLPLFTFTDPDPAAAFIKAVHITELRAALNDARTATGAAPISYIDETVTPGVTVVRTTHIQQIRDGVK